MKKFRKNLLLALSLMVIILYALGCSANTKGEMAYDSGSSSAPAAPPVEGVKEDGGLEAELEAEKIITTINLEFETTEFNESIEQLMDLIEEYQAYVESSNISYNRHYNNRSYRHGYYTIRVPQDDITSFKKDLQQIGNIISESTSKDDVTKSYKDIEARLKVVTVKEERLLSLMEKAEKIEDLIALENQLTEVIYEKERLNSQLMDIDDRVDYSTFILHIQEVDKLTSTETVETSFGTRIKNAIEHSLYNFVDGLQNMVIGLIYLAPFLVLIGIILFISYRIFKKIRGKGNRLD